MPPSGGVVTIVLYFLTALQVWPSVEGHQKRSYIGEVITWSIFHLSHPLEAVCMYLLSCFQLALWFICVQILYLFCSRPPNRTTHLALAELGFGIWQLASKTNSLPVFSLKFKSWIDLHSKFCKRAGKMTFKIEFSIAPI